MKDRKFVNFEKTDQRLHTKAWETRFLPKRNDIFTIVLLESLLLLYKGINDGITLQSKTCKERCKTKYVYIEMCIGVIIKVCHKILYGKVVRSRTFPNVDVHILLRSKRFIETSSVVIGYKFFRFHKSQGL